MSPLVRSTMTPVRRAKASDSEIGTQMMESPFRRRWRQLPLTGTPCYTVLQTDYFHKNRHTGPTTDDGFHPESSAGPSDARRMEGGVAGLR